MSDILQRSVYSLQRILQSTLGETSDFLSFLPPSLNKKANDFLEQIQHSSSKKERQYYIQKCISEMQYKLSQPGIGLDEVSFCLVLSLHIKALGHDVSFANIHAVKLAQQGTLRQKQIGYDVTSLLLPPRHDLYILLINTIQKDLNGSVEEIYLGLRAVTYIFTTDLLGPLLPLVERRLAHPQPHVRILAVVAAHHCLRQMLVAPSSSLVRGLCQCLGDPSIAVVGAAAPALYTLLLHQRVPEEVQDAVTTAAIQLLQKVVRRELPVSLERKGVPLPWLQVFLLQVLGILGDLRPAHVAAIVGAVKEVLSRIQANQLMSYAIISECVLVLVALHSHPEAMSLALPAISSLIYSRDTNLKVVGLKCLVKAAKHLRSESLVEFNDAILESLRHQDDEVKHMTIGLLVEIASPANHTSILVKVLQVLDHSATPTAAFLGQHLTRLLNKVPMENQFLVKYVHQLAHKCPSLVTMDLVNSVLQNLRKGEDGKRDQLAAACLEVCQQEVRESTKGPEPLLCFSTWVLGEWGGPESQQVLSDSLFKSSTTTLPEIPALWMLSALRKLAITHGSPAPSLVPELGRLCELHPPYSILHMKAKELQRILHHLPKLHGAKLKRIPVDPTLTCLDGYVVTALENGAQPYVPLPEISIEMPDAKASPKTSESFPSSGTSTPGESLLSCSPSYLSLDSLSSACSPLRTEPTLASSLPISRVWTTEGRIEQSQTQGNPNKEAADLLFPASSQQPVGIAKELDDLCLFPDLLKQKDEDLGLLTPPSSDTATSGSSH